MAVSKNFLHNIPSDSIPSQWQIKLASHGEQPAIAGNYLINNDSVIFEPLIPFTKGLAYDIFLRRKLFNTITIPKANDSPKLMAIYPSSDTLPANLLKIYLVFSRPMAQGHSLQFIKLTNEKGDSLPNTFLALRSELWNEDGTILTLWLDPGRIKKDLQPNKLLGPPLVRGNTYKLIISGKWRGDEGNDLAESYTKIFVAAGYDSIAPSIDKWKLVIPKPGASAPLEIAFDKTLDYELILNAIRVVDSAGNIIAGAMQVNKGETKLYFTPAIPWKKGIYKLLAEGRLADLAGNNLNRLFDVDLENKDRVESEKKFFEKKWRVE